MNIPELFVTALIFFYGWSDEFTSVKLVKWQLDLRKCTVIDWRSYIREVCTSNFLTIYHGKIRKLEKIVEIDDFFPFARSKKINVIFISFRRYLSNNLPYSRSTYDAFGYGYSPKIVDVYRMWRHNHAFLALKLIVLRQVCFIVSGRPDSSQVPSFYVLNKK